MRGGKALSESCSGEPLPFSSCRQSPCSRDYYRRSRVVVLSHLTFPIMKCPIVVEVNNGDLDFEEVQRCTRYLLPYISGQLPYYLRIPRTDVISLPVKSFHRLEIVDNSATAGGVIYASKSDLL